MTNAEIAEIFEHIAEILEIKGENPFKIRAYLNASAAISRLGENLSDIIIEGKNLNIPGIGKDLHLKIKELVETGNLAYYDELLKSVPDGLFELLKIRGLGPKKAMLLYENFNIKSAADLENALKLGKLKDIHGFGEKSIENLKKSVEEFNIFKTRFLYPDALNQALMLEYYLKNTPQKIILDIQTAGSLRRKMETVGDIDIVLSVATGKEQLFFERLFKYPEILRTESSGETKTSIILRSGIRVDFRIVPREDFVYAFHHFTGSKMHNEELRLLEKANGYKINEYGIFKRNKNEDSGADISESKTNKIEVNDEREFYGVFGMQYIPPELREGAGELDAALNGGIPALIEEKDLRGVFHIHTTYTDGKESMEAMVEECIRLGYEYAGISDHSVSAHYANGLSADELESQIEYIDRLNKKYADKIKIFKGVESDILPDGNLDYDEKTLSKLDFVIASVHSNFNMTESLMTERIVKAIKNPYTTMIGHLTGRLLLERKEYPLNIGRILDFASEFKTVIELNANPKRLDIDWRHIKSALSKNVMLSINPDAHKTEGIRFVNYGIGIARKGWAKKSDILNTGSASEVYDILTSIRDFKKKKAKIF
ncbi:MAG: DNA polymerase/3'-5' exonuclease PolX [Candidatus Acidulodesulfobacterium acidiphilum]|uniref:DNA polymerase beta n=1 Tax=Candidatus Acidulodesulfobacterium acidiphilum TaxID=2597224 RepID=A0A520XBJ0_9DELT|nr:MAG: DNA polymerase/3'-5' exonuclease PolX [Candidatus Acidulodesulfobacterium acidiphilum]